MCAQLRVELRSLYIAARLLATDVQLGLYIVLGKSAQLVDWLQVGAGWHTHQLAVIRNKLTLLIRTAELSRMWPTFVTQIVRCAHRAVHCSDCHVGTQSLCLLQTCHAMLHSLSMQVVSVHFSLTDAVTLHCQLWCFSQHLHNNAISCCYDNHWLCCSYCCCCVIHQHTM